MSSNWMNKPDPFYRTYAQPTLSAYETYGEWKKRMECRPHHFDVSTKVCVPGGYQDRGSPPAMPLPLVPPLPVRSCTKRVGGEYGIMHVSTQCADCYPDIIQEDYIGLRGKRDAGCSRRF